jgi:hypothetical protein
MHRLSLLLAPPRRDFAGPALILSPILSASYPHRVHSISRAHPLKAPRGCPFRFWGGAHSGPGGVPIQVLRGAHSGPRGCQFRS